MLTPEPAQVLLLLALFLLYALTNLVRAAMENMNRTTQRAQAEAGHLGSRRALALDEGSESLDLACETLSLLLVLLFAWQARDAFLSSPAGTLPQVLLVLTTGLLLLVAGRMIPEASGAAWADRLAPTLAGMVLLLLRLAWPVLAVLLPVRRYLLRVTGAARQVGSVTEEEIMTLVDAGQKGGAIEDEEKAMIFSVLQFTDTLVREVMVPRIDMVGVSRDTGLQEALGLLVRSGHSRLPVHDGNIDRIEGLLYAKDLLAAWLNDADDPPSIRELMRPAHFVAADRRADLVLKELQRSKIHLAIVLDEYGGTAGVVTLEDLVEEIVGDIKDEYDTGEEVEFVRQADDQYSIEASMDLHDVNELLQVDLPTDTSDTLGGFIYDLLGRVPRVGEELAVTDHGLTLRIDSLEGLRIRKVRVTRAGESLATATGKAGDES